MVTASRPAPLYITGGAGGGGDGPHPSPPLLGLSGWSPHLDPLPRISLEGREVAWSLPPGPPARLPGVTRGVQGFPKGFQGSTKQAGLSEPQRLPDSPRQPGAAQPAAARPPAAPPRPLPATMSVSPPGSPPSRVTTPGRSRSEGGTPPWSWAGDWLAHGALEDWLDYGALDHCPPGSPLLSVSRVTTPGRAPGGAPHPWARDGLDVSAAGQASGTLGDRPKFPTPPGRATPGPRRARSRSRSDTPLPLRCVSPDQACSWASSQGSHSVGPGQNEQIVDSTDQIYSRNDQTWPKANITDPLPFPPGGVAPAISCLESSLPLLPCEQVFLSRISLQVCTVAG